MNCQDAAIFIYKDDLLPGCPVEYWTAGKSINVHTKQLRRSKDLGGHNASNNYNFQNKNQPLSYHNFHGAECLVLSSQQEPRFGLSRAL